MKQYPYGHLPYPQAIPQAPHDPWSQRRPYPSSHPVSQMMLIPVSSTTLRYNPDHWYHPSGSYPLPPPNNAQIPMQTTVSMKELMNETRIESYIEFENIINQRAFHVNEVFIDMKNGMSLEDLLLKYGFNTEKATLQTSEDDGIYFNNSKEIADEIEEKENSEEKIKKPGKNLKKSRKKEKKNKDKKKENKEEENEADSGGWFGGGWFSSSPKNSDIETSTSPPLSSTTSIPTTTATTQMTITPAKLTTVTNQYYGFFNYFDSSPTASVPSTTTEIPFRYTNDDEEESEDDIGEITTISPNQGWWPMSSTSDNQENKNLNDNLRSRSKINKKVDIKASVPEKSQKGYAFPFKLFIGVVCLLGFVVSLLGFVVCFNF